MFFLFVFFFTINNRCFLLRCFFLISKIVFSFLGIFSSFYRNFIFIRFFFLPFFLLLKDSFKSIFLKTPLVLILVFLATLVFYVRLALFYFTYEGTFSFTSFFFAFLSVYSGGKKGGTLQFLRKL